MTFCESIKFSAFIIFYQVWNDYVNLTELLSGKKAFAPEMKKPDRDNFISSSAEFSTSIDSLFGYQYLCSVHNL